jgi:ATP-dependent DNA helicase RecQ
MTVTLASTTLLAYEAALARLVLLTILEGTPALGRPPSRAFIAGTLAGSLRQDLVAADAHRLSTFGLLAKHGLTEIRQLVDRLVEAGLVEPLRARGGLVCTAAGRGILEGTARAGADAGGSGPLRLLAGAVDPARLDVAVRSGLVDALRRYRAERAHVEDVPEHRVFSEATLRELAAARPSTEVGLLAVPGLGPKRVAAHGFELLRILAEHGPVVGRLEGLSGEPGDEVDAPLTAPLNARPARGP